MIKLMKNDADGNICLNVNDLRSCATLLKQ